MMKLRRDQRHQTKRINTKMQCNHRCSMLSTDFSTNRAPNFFQLRLFNLITLGNASAENKGLEFFLYQVWVNNKLNKKKKEKKSIY